MRSLRVLNTDATSALFGSLATIIVSVSKLSLVQIEITEAELN